MWGDVTFFEDGTPYSYVGGPEGRGVLNIGWLDGTREYPRGGVPTDFVVRLREVCACGTRRTRGWHRCNLCPKGAPYPVAIARADGGQYLVGDAEIRVAGHGQVVYAAPTMVIHYVQDHGYRPPDGFIAAVLES